MVEKWIEQFNECSLAAKEFKRITNNIKMHDLIALFNGEVYPYAVNISFACELFLKAIKIYETKGCNYIHTHDLKELYDDLSITARENIEKEFDKYNENPFYGLYDFLKKENKTFEQWRYPFENDTEINITLFTYLSDCLEKYVDELRTKIYQSNCKSQQ